ncbi:MAG: hypothetical protein ACUVS3_03435 [Thermodesulfobacteriota bacterium]
MGGGVFNDRQLAVRDVIRKPVLGGRAPRRGPVCVVVLPSGIFGCYGHIGDLGRRIDAMSHVVDLHESAFHHRAAKGV